MRLIQIVKPVFVGERHRAEGEAFEADDRIAARLVAQGLAQHAVAVVMDPEPGRAVDPKGKAEKAVKAK